jgi:hypothetical protein
MKEKWDEEMKENTAFGMEGTLLNKNTAFGMPWIK